jgi:Right handed beta helix region
LIAWKTVPDIPRCAPLVGGICFLALAAVAPQSQAATWRVAQDGSGDFDNLFAVANAVASGDTVLIAAGVYDSTASFVGSAGDRTTCFPIKVEELTIIGDSQADVVIGPPVPSGSTGNGPYAIYGIAAATTIRLSNATVRNARVGLNTRAGGTVQNVHFAMNDIGIFDAGIDGLDVSGCLFEDNDDGYFALGSSFATIADCIFVGGQRISVVFLGAVGGRVLDCSFPGGRVGIQFEQGSTNGIVSSSTFGVFESASIALRTFSSAQVTDCTMPGSLWGNTVHIQEDSSLLMARCLIGEGLAGWSIDTRSPVTLEIRQCNILPGAGFAIKLGTMATAASIINMPLNYWGTTDPQEIQNLIWDASDDSTTMATVIYEPFANQSVSNEKKTVSGLKGMFRSHR